MLVIALERGFYGGKIQEPPEAGGEPFHILNENHLGKWMQPQGWKPSGKAQAATSPATTTGSQGGGADAGGDGSADDDYDEGPDA